MLPLLLLPVMLMLLLLLLMLPPPDHVGQQSPCCTSLCHRILRALSLLQRCYDVQRA
jgi:hypothetical protein